MRQTLTLFTALFMMCSLTFALAQEKSGAKDAKVEEELRNLVHAWDEAEVKGDTTTLDRLLADEFSFVGGPTKSEYLASAKVKTPDTYLESAVSTDIQVKLYKDFAIVTGLDTVKGKNKGRDYTIKWLYMDVWVKRSSRWQCVKTHLAPHNTRTP